MNELKGLRVLIVEDESIVAMFLEDILEGMGCVIAGVAASAGEAMAIIGQADIQAAILDVNLDEGRSMIVADLLHQKCVPFIFETGYGKAGVPKQFADVPLLPKPFTSEDLTKTLATVTRRVR